MARQLRWWIAAPLGACLVFAIAYLPPRPMPLLGQRVFRLAQTFEPPTPYRQRVQELAGRYRRTAFELAMREYEDSLRPELEQHRAQEVPGPAVYFAGPDSLSDSAQGLVRALLERAWNRLGLGISKISVGVVISVVFQRPPPQEAPAHFPQADVDLIPDSTNRTTCLAFIPIIYWGRPGILKLARPAPTAKLAEQLQRSLGTCAYFAKFGAPGQEIARWLTSRHYDLAEDPWTMRTPARSSRVGLWDPDFNELLDPDKPWFWFQVYRYGPDAVGCIAGRPAACGRAALAGGPGPTSPIVSTEQNWRTPASPAGANRYFADLVDDIGPERFGRFWNSELPPDTALATAMRMPVGEWTRRWQATLVPPIRLGPVAPPSAMMLATLLGVVAVALVMLTAKRRQVR
ncbi:MAG TPA: hypothetical protein VFP39_12890 [Gemmatimonadales bacterium]|nr:hypothetical protein [Gemmatimonadales bacterium]